jgi:hypothetical protein
MFYTCIRLDKFTKTSKNFSNLHDNRYSVFDSPQLGHDEYYIAARWQGNLRNNSERNFVNRHLSK